MSAERHVHPGVAGREDEMADLASALRRLTAATVLNRADPDDVEGFAAELHEIADRLEKHIPDPPPAVTDVSSPMRQPTTTAAEMVSRMAFDVVVGPYTPLALPLTLSFEPPGAVGRAHFTLPYEGPPGCVHGGVLASTFDIVLSAANTANETPGVTAKLALRYRRATLLHEEAVFEAWVEKTEGRRVFTHGRLVQLGVTTVEAQGVFARIGDRTKDLAHERRRAHDAKRAKG